MLYRISPSAPLPETSICWNDEVDPVIMRISSQNDLLICHSNVKSLHCWSLSFSSAVALILIDLFLQCFPLFHPTRFSQQCQRCFNSWSSPFPRNQWWFSHVSITYFWMEFSFKSIHYKLYWIFSNKAKYQSAQLCLLHHILPTGHFVWCNKCPCNHCYGNMLFTYVQLLCDKISVPVL